MEITLIDNVSKSELAEIKKMIGEAFITNELFHEFGDINDRKELVMKYMDIYIQIMCMNQRHFMEQRITKV